MQEIPGCTTISHPVGYSVKHQCLNFSMDSKGSDPKNFKVN